MQNPRLQEIYPSTQDLAAHLGRQTSGGEENFAADRFLGPWGHGGSGANWERPMKCAEQKPKLQMGIPPAGKGTCCVDPKWVFWFRCQVNPGFLPMKTRMSLHPNKSEVQPSLISCSIIKLILEHSMLWQVNVSTQTHVGILSPWWSQRSGIRWELHGIFGLWGLCFMNGEIHSWIILRVGLLQKPVWLLLWYAPL